MMGKKAGENFFGWCWWAAGGEMRRRRYFAAVPTSQSFRRLSAAAIPSSPSFRYYSAAVGNGLKITVNTLQVSLTNAVVNSARKPSKVSLNCLKTGGNRLKVSLKVPESNHLQTLQGQFEQP